MSGLVSAFPLFLLPPPNVVAAILLCIRRIFIANVDQVLRWRSLPECGESRIGCGCPVGGHLKRIKSDRFWRFAWKVRLVPRRRAHPAASFPRRQDADDCRDDEDEEETTDRGDSHDDWECEEIGDGASRTWRNWRCRSACWRSACWRISWLHIRRLLREHGLLRDRQLSVDSTIGPLTQCVERW